MDFKYVIFDFMNYNYVSTSWVSVVFFYSFSFFIGFKYVYSFIDFEFVSTTSWVLSCVFFNLMNFKSFVYRF